LNGERVEISVIICTLDKKQILPETIPSIKRSSLVSELIINELECILQNHTLKKFAANARFVRKKALEDVGGYEHTIGGETVYAARKILQHGWKIKIVDYPLLHKMHENGYAWILNIYGTGKIRAHELREHRELLSYFKKALGSVIRGFQLSILYKEPLLSLFYPLRCWLYLAGAIHGNLKMGKTKSCEY
jgi:hypothetical protein